MNGTIENNVYRLDPFAMRVIGIVCALVTAGIIGSITTEIITATRLASMHEQIKTLTEQGDYRQRQIERFGDTLNMHMMDPHIHRAGFLKLDDRLQRIEDRLTKIEQRLETRQPP